MHKLAVVLVLVAACGSKKKEGEGGGGGGGETKPAEAKLEFKKLGGLPLEAEVPSDANIDDTSKGAGYPSVTIYASPTTFVSGGGEMSDLKPTLEETKARMEKEPGNKFKKWGKEEKTADGWVLEAER